MRSLLFANTPDLFTALKVSIGKKDYSDDLYPFSLPAIYFDLFSTSLSFKGPLKTFVQTFEIKCDCTAKSSKIFYSTIPFFV